MDSYQKFVYSTDWHVTARWPESRTDNYLQTILSKIRWVIDFANEEDAIILLGGDMIDTYNTRPEVINLVIKELRRARNPVYSLVGNHDIYGQNFNVIDNVILGTVFSSGTAQMITAAPTFINKNGVVVQLTGANYMPDMEANKDIYCTVKDPRADQAIHVVHGMLVRKHIPVMGSDKVTLVTEVFTQADVICSGHEHVGYGVFELDGTLYTNPGALGRVQANMREISRMPCISLIKCFKDHSEIAIVPVEIAKPGDQVLSRTKLEEEIARLQKLNDFRETITGPRIISDTNEIFDQEAQIANVADDILDVCKRALIEFDRSTL